MAITGIDYLFWKELRDEGMIPPEPAVLELGQANWFGDIDPKCLVGDVAKYAHPLNVESLLAKLNRPSTPEVSDLFLKAEVFYEAILRTKQTLAVDLHGTPCSLASDLNQPLELSSTGDWQIIINTGTAEHVFNQCQFFETCHEYCDVRGLMVHFLPAWGWLDHGFYNYHPTFVADLAAANGYDVVKWWLYDLPANRKAVITQPQDVHAYAKIHGMGGSTMHAVCLRKTKDSPFAMPMQGYYAGTLDAERQVAWKSGRDW